MASTEVAENAAAPAVDAASAPLAMPEPEPMTGVAIDTPGTAATGGDHSGPRRSSRHSGVAPVSAPLPAPKRRASKRNADEVADGEAGGEEGAKKVNNHYITSVTKG